MVDNSDAILTSDDSIMSRAFYWLRSFYIPTSPNQLLESQRKLLQQFVKRPVEHKKFVLSSGDYLNYVDVKGNSSSSTSSHQQSKPTLILMHGYGSGLGMFFANYDRFADQFDRVVAIDWLGMGGSSRFKPLPRPPLIYGAFQLSQAVDYFIDSLEETRKGLGIQKNFVLAGHSLGGYLSARYAMKYKDEGMRGLLLFSPAGLEPLTDHVLIPQEEITNWKLIWAERLWKCNFTPQGIVRLMGPWGTNAVKNLVNMRFGQDKWPESHAGLISDYLFHLCALPYASETALNVIFEPKMVKVIQPGLPDGQRPRVFTKEPISSDDLGTALSEKQRSKSVPLLVMYGDKDWMAFPTADRFTAALEQEHNVDATFATVSGAGHHLYLDNVDHFHSIIDDWLNERVLR